MVPRIAGRAPLDDIEPPTQACTRLWRGGRAGTNAGSVVGRSITNAIHPSEPHCIPLVLDPALPSRALRKLLLRSLAALYGGTSYASAANTRSTCALVGSDGARPSRRVKYVVAD